jgi:hypothetical protein
VAGADEKVCDALLKENCASSIVCLLDSLCPDLIHRALVLVYEMLLVYPEGDNDSIKVATHMLEGGVVPAMGSVVKLRKQNSKNNQQAEQLAELAKTVAQMLSRALNAKSLQRVEEL